MTSYAIPVEGEPFAVGSFTQPVNFDPLQLDAGMVGSQTEPQLPGSDGPTYSTAAQRAAWRSGSKGRFVSEAPSWNASRPDDAGNYTANLDRLLGAPLIGNLPSGVRQVVDVVDMLGGRLASSALQAESYPQRYKEAFFGGTPVDPVSEGLNFAGVASMPAFARGAMVGAPTVLPRRQPTIFDPAPQGPRVFDKLEPGKIMPVESTTVPDQLPGLGDSLTGTRQNLADRSSVLSEFPNKPPRPFEWDYPAGPWPKGPPADMQGRLMRDIDERPLNARYIIGRRMVGGEDEAVTAGDLDSIAQGVLGQNKLQNVPADSLPEGSSATFNRDTLEIQMSKDLSPSDRSMAVAHELAHALDHIAGEYTGPETGFSIPLRAGAAREFDTIYNDGNNPLLAEARRSNPNIDPSTVPWGTGMAPQFRGYEESEVPSEYMAEAIRAYLTNPNYIKTVAPRTASAIRSYVNWHPWLSPWIQFNGLAGLGFGVAAAASQLKTEPERKDPLASRQSQ